METRHIAKFHIHVEGAIEQIKNYHNYLGLCANHIIFWVNNLPHDQGQDSPIWTGNAQLMRCLLYGKHEQFYLFNVADISLAHPFYFFSHHAFWHFHKLK